MMSDKTGIEWTDATWNPVTGCTKVSQGCKNCYAEHVSRRFGKGFSKIELHPEKLDWPLRWRGSKQAKAEGRPSRIFVNSMSDLFHEKVTDEFIMEVFEVMRRANWHTFQVLTKRPARMRELIERPKEPVLRSVRIINFPNVWLGVSVENQETANERIPLLLETPAAVRFVSYEPALGQIDSTNGLYVIGCGDDCQCVPRIDWVIAGGESGPHARPAHPDWFRAARDQCQAADVPFFFKQWGEWAEIYDARFPNRVIYCDGRTCDLTVEAIITEEKRSGIKNAQSFGRIVSRLGKKRAGHLLDGREWNEFPKEEAR